MLKTALSGALLATASGMTQQEIQARAHEQILKFTHPLQHNPRLMSAVAAQGAKLSSASPSLAAASVPARGVSKSETRALRGKGGKGKGKGKGKDDDDEEEGDMPRRYLQYEAGYCAGTEVDGVTLTEDLFVASMQFADNVCVNVINEDGEAVSYKQSLSMSAEQKIVITWSYYFFHYCEEEYKVEEEVDPDVSFGMDIPANGMCTSIGIEDVGARLALTETSFGADKLVAAKVEFQNTHVNDCIKARQMGDLSRHDYIEIERLMRQTPSGWVPHCYSNDDGGDDVYDDDDNDDLLVAGGSHMYDLSSCGDTMDLRRVRYATPDCSGTGEVDSMPHSFCLFDREMEELVAYSQMCSPPPADTP